MPKFSLKLSNRETQSNKTTHQTHIIPSYNKISFLTPPTAKPAYKNIIDSAEHTQQNFPPLHALTIDPKAEVFYENYTPSKRRMLLPCQRNKKLILPTF